MPELPEVETIITRLRDGTKETPSVIGETIQTVIVHWDKIIAAPDPETFMKNLQGKQLIDARRRGKFLHFPLNKGHLIGHLRMSGDMRMENRVTQNDHPAPLQPYDKVILNFYSPWRLVFSNIRKFGRLWYTNDPHEVFSKLGPEPLDECFTPDRLFNMLHQHNRQIKPLLLDQTFLAGLGNIYSDESLFLAKIHPLRKSNSITNAEANQLHNAIQMTLKQGIKQFGASLDWVYRGGQFQNCFNVYQQDGEPCTVCGAVINKIYVGQRGTRYCPNCQVIDP